MPRDDSNQLPLFDSQVGFGLERPSLAYVVQKHRATRLHFDLRLEIGGIMKSWAMREGPSIDPWATRLAVQVRDHAKAHNAFEGVIPPGRNGAGPVMLRDYGTFAPTEGGAFDVEMLRDAYEAGTLSFVLFGERLGGRWTLMRRPGQDGERSQWELQKHGDSFSSRLFEPADEFRTSVVTGRTMAEIEAARAARSRPPHRCGSRSRAALQPNPRLQPAAPHLNTRVSPRHAIMSRTTEELESIWRYHA